MVSMFLHSEPAVVFFNFPQCFLNSRDVCFENASKLFTVCFRETDGNPHFHFRYLNPSLSTLLFRSTKWKRKTVMKNHHFNLLVTFCSWSTSHGFDQRSVWYILLFITLALSKNKPSIVVIVVYSTFLRHFLF